MWRIRFEKEGGGALFTRSGIYNIEAAAFYAEAILSNPDKYLLLDSETEKIIPATEALSSYTIEDYFLVSK